MESKEKSLKVYYDGLCHLCSREIDHYRLLRGAGAIEFIDITSNTFNAQSEGLDPFKVHKIMHVRRCSDGQILTAVDAFIEIWRQLPQYQWAAKIAARKFPKTVLTIFYHLFAKSRPYLPKRKKDCTESPYCDLN
ncbi:MAG: DUF393 domain-containing protein [Bdellovibrionaceae bacterium]|nr:DUF393 domain-containing protein [Pseudobdellovibrionaceae bacterium]NUM57040.1 DUF393 domain-containing protein [Pseudobdellovibrionaceae bacterium]